MYPYLRTITFIAVLSVTQFVWAQDDKITQEKENLLEQIERLKQEIEIRELEMQRDELMRSKPPSRRTIEMKNGISEQNAEYMMQSLMMRQSQGVQIIGGNEDLSMIEIMGPEEFLDEAEEMIKKFDVPTPSTAEFFFYLIRASDEKKESKFPKNIQNVIEQLDKNFAFENYNTMDVSMIRMGTQSPGTIEGNLNQSGSDFKNGKYGIRLSAIKFKNAIGEPKIEISEFSFSFTAEAVTGTGRIDVPDTNPNSGFTARLPTTSEKINAELSTNFSIKSGQSIVLGKLNAEGTSDGFFVVVTANILN
jgi:hypothetical protein